jgi:hypothetical protein
MAHNLQSAFFESGFWRGDRARHRQRFARSICSLKWRIAIIAFSEGLENAVFYKRAYSFGWKKIIFGQKRSAPRASRAASSPSLTMEVASRVFDINVT